MKLDTIYYDSILNGVKEYETRVFDDKRQKIKLLDVVEFSDRGSNRTFEAKITELAWFPNFRDAITDVGIRKVLPNAQSLDDGVITYENFDGGNYKKNAEKFGVLRMKFMLMSVQEGER